MDVGDAPCNSFFKSLKDGISSIKTNISDVEKQMQVPIVELPENQAIIKLIKASEEINEMKVSGNEMKKGLEETNQRNLQYFNHMDSLLKNIEDRVENLITRLKDFGYSPLPIEEPSQEPRNSPVISTIEDQNSVLTVANHEVNNNTVDGLLLKTPILSNSNFKPLVDNKVLLKEVTRFQSLKHIDQSNLRILETDDSSSFCLMPDSSSTLSSDMTSISSQAEMCTFSEKFEEIQNDNNRDTPEEPIVLSQKKIRDLREKLATPEDPNRRCFTNQEKSPETPKTPALTSFYGRI